MSKDTKLFEVVLESGTFLTENVIPKYENRGGWKPSNPKHITAFIPGTIVQLNVKAGDNVKEGEVLMLFGAMKMDNVITAPFDAKIKTVNANIGESVPKGFVIIELE